MRPALRLAACRAVLAGDVPATLAKAAFVRCVEMRPARRAVSPAASYAVDAVTALETPLDDAAIFTFAGPPGSALHLFDAGRDPASGRLVGPGFGLERSRHIHPFLLLLALQNQVAATLSLELGLHGPCTSATDSASAFADLVPNMARAARARPVLAVLASAANRAEHKSRGILETGGDRAIEGAVALLFTAQGGLGEVTADGERGNATDAATSGGDALGSDGASAVFAPVLEPGLGILAALADGRSRARLAIREPLRITAFRFTGTGRRSA